MKYYKNYLSVVLLALAMVACSDSGNKEPGGSTGPDTSEDGADGGGAGGESVPDRAGT